MAFEGYRYGFNGIEHDAEWGIYAAEYRFFDSRLGRWLSPDPIFHPHMSPYVGMDDNPVALCDPYGLATGDPPLGEEDLTHGTGDDCDFPVEIGGSRSDCPKDPTPNSDPPDLSGKLSDKAADKITSNGIDGWYDCNGDFLVGRGAPAEVTKHLFESGYDFYSFTAYKFVDTGEPCARVTHENSSSFTNVSLNWDTAIEVAKIGLGFTPLGIVLDVYDLGEAIMLGDALAVSIAVVGFVPGGDMLKAFSKTLKYSDEAAAIFKKVDVVVPSLRGNFLSKYGKGAGIDANTLNPAGIYSGKTVSSYQEALTGGKHSGWLKNMLARSTPELQKSVSSMQANILEHQNLISNPELYMKQYGKGDWNSLDPRRQQHLLNVKWPSDIQRALEQIDILNGIINSR